MRGVTVMRVMKVTVTEQLPRNDPEIQVESQKTPWVKNQKLKKCTRSARKLPAAGTSSALKRGNG